MWLICGVLCGYVCANYGTVFLHEVKKSDCAGVTNCCFFIYFCPGTNNVLCMVSHVNQIVVRSDAACCLYICRGRDVGLLLYCAGTGFVSDFH